MLIAVFGPSTAWAGKKITREGDAFILEDYGLVSAQAVMEYDVQGHLVWVSEEMRAWVGSLRTTTQPLSQPGGAVEPPKAMRVATFGPTTAWPGKTITFENNQFILEGHGRISAQDIMGYDQQGGLDWPSDGIRAWVGSLGSSAPPSPPSGATGNPPGAELIATFGSTSGWAGKTIIYDKGAFILGGHGPITAAAVMEYDRQGILVWANQSPMAVRGSRAWVSSLLTARVQSQASVSNTLLWIVAFSPLWLGVLLVMVPTRLAFYILPFALLMWDRDNVKKAGAEIKGLLLWAILFAPVYMYIRLRRTNQSLGPFIASLPCFALSSIIGLTAVWRVIWG